MTNKIKFKLKITGFELEVEGARENTAQITAQVGETLRGLISPPTLGDEEFNSNGNGKTVDGEATIVASTNGSTRKKGARKQRQQNQGLSAQSSVVDFKHEPENYGTPLQEWTTAKKSVWLLYVIKNILNLDGLSTIQITDTFNKHFRQSKLINKGNVFRDLGKLKAKANSIVGEDTSSQPNVWYLTEEGSKHVQKIIAEQKTQANGVS